MTLPDLLPDVRFETLPRDDTALRYAFEAKRAAMGPYIVECWGVERGIAMAAARRALCGEAVLQNPLGVSAPSAQSHGCSSLTTFASASSTSIRNSSAKGWAAESFGIAFGWRTRRAYRSGRNISNGIPWGRCIGAMASPLSAKPRFIGLWSVLLQGHRLGCRPSMRVVARAVAVDVQRRLGEARAERADHFLQPPVEFLRRRRDFLPSHA